MKSERFEWDDLKATKNWRDHAVTFDMARAAFDDIFAIEWEDNAQGANEQRIVMLGMTQNVLLFVSYTMRGQRARIISARKAEPYERRKYHDENRET